MAENMQRIMHRRNNVYQVKIPIWIVNKQNNNWTIREKLILYLDSADSKYHKEFKKFTVILYYNFMELNAIISCFIYVIVLHVMYIN